MTPSADITFSGSYIWVDFTHKKYLTSEEIRQRIDRKTAADWPNIKEKIQLLRKQQAIHFPIPSIDKHFWLFPSDCMAEKISSIETRGNRLNEKIKNQSTFKFEFLLNAAVEEAITSAIYEGANSTRAKAEQLIAEKRTPISKDEWMLFNNYLAMQWIKGNHSRKVDLDLIREIHSIVTKNTMTGDDVNYIGKFRDNAVVVGPHEGVEEKLIEESLKDAINIITNHPRFIPPLIKGILLHYFIGYIHPFFDGNGRTARTLFYFKCIRNGLEFVELLSISAHLKEHGKRYERAFENAVGHDGDVTYFVDFCLDSILFALNQVGRKVEYLFTLGEFGKSISLTETQTRLLQRLALNKFRTITIDECAKELGRSREAARLELKHLCKLGLMEEKKMKQKFVYNISSQNLKERVSKFQDEKDDQLNLRF